MMKTIDQQNQQNQGMATDAAVQTQAASTAGVACPLAASKGCQRAQWCHDKNRLLQEQLRERPEKPVIRRLNGNDKQRQVRAAALKQARATPSSALVEWESQQRSLPPRLRAQPSSTPIHPLHYWLDQRRGLAHLRYLETLQALAQIRCWLLRRCIAPWLS